MSVINSQNNVLALLTRPKSIVPNSLDNVFDVVVIATMSAGKSTVINALIGHELLHSANEATTATITRIHDKDGQKIFSGSAYAKLGHRLSDKPKLKLIEHSEKLDGELLRQWNAAEEIDYIDITGDVRMIRNKAYQLVIYDTPGPNNSQDDNHAELTMEVINDGKFGLILYVLNATQIGITDDRHLLEQVLASIKKDQQKEIIFLLNKADCFDKEKGETLFDAVKNAQDYLANIGFVDPTIIPTSAAYALLSRKALWGDSLTRVQRNQLLTGIDELDDELLKNAIVPNNIRNKVRKKLNDLKTRGQVEINGQVVFKKSLNKYFIRSGFGLVEAILQSKLV